MAAEVKPRSIHTAPTVPGPARPARQPARKSQHHVIMAVIGLGVLKHLACDSRTYERMIMAAIGFAAVLGLGRAGGAGAFGRLAALDKRRALGALNDAKQAQAAAPSDAQKQAIKGLIDRLEAKQDINK